MVNCPQSCIPEEEQICTTFPTINIIKEKPYSFFQKETYVKYNTCTDKIITQYDIYQVNSIYSDVFTGMVWLIILFIILRSLIKELKK